MKAALGSGLVGAVAVTALNMLGRRFLPQAPRLDVLGMRLASGAFRKAKMKQPSRPVLFVISLIGDLVSNSVFYSLVGAGKSRFAALRGALLGLVAGTAAVKMPEPLGLGRKPTNRKRHTPAFTIAWYVLGGLIAAISYQKLRASRVSR